ncbi:hypothetical protein KPSA1_06969 [Pseudomonas syringae pv. actinidiae]|uniref:Uncharacterized protein n=1 Tax=Pseudomonas syringae pv. actinidiae TaxID=103796 RepID=A0A2V0QXW3_PSESF|nr:hypothetical protein KPSA1_06969 [Pseudomonas syringae pv. actinidiae]
MLCHFCNVVDKANNVFFSIFFGSAYAVKKLVQDFHELSFGIVFKFFFHIIVVNFYHVAYVVLVP